MTAAATMTRSRTPWEDRFTTPTEDALLADVAHPGGAALRDVLERLGAMAGLERGVAWQGVPWRWTIVFRRAGEEASLTPPPAFAYVIPHPVQPGVCLPLSAAVAAALPVKKLKKGVRDVLVHAPVVDGVHWASWELAGEGSVEVADVIEIAERKHAAILSQGPAARDEGKN
jgi:hypothetical protein